MQGFVLKYAMASETFEELRAALSKVVESAKDLEVQIKRELDSVIGRSGGYIGGGKETFSMAAFQERFTAELNAVVARLFAEYAASRSEDSNEERSLWCVRPDAVSEAIDWFENTSGNIVNELSGLPKETTRKHFQGLRVALVKFSPIACAFSQTAASRRTLTTLFKGRLIALHPKLHSVGVVLLVAKAIGLLLGQPSLGTVLRWLGFYPEGPRKGILHWLFRLSLRLSLPRIICRPCTKLLLWTRHSCEKLVFPSSVIFHGRE